MNKKLQLLQISRGIAAFFVVAFHCYMNSLFHFNEPTYFAPAARHGWLGVEYFFVLSGFIITYIHWDDLQQKRGIAVFLKKRFIRIYPIYWFVASVMLLYYLFIKKDSSGIVVKIHSFADVQYVIKCYLLLPMPATHKNFIDSAWTLSYEVLFYTVFALCLRWGIKTVKYVFTAWALLILLLHYTSMAGIFAPFRFLFNTLILYFLVGCLIASFVRLKTFLLTVKNFTGLLFLGSAIMYFYCSFSKSSITQDRLDVNHSYFFMLLFSLVLWGCVSVDFGKKNIRWPGILLLAGDASYSIYLIHIPVILFFYKLANAVSHKYYFLSGPLFFNLLFLTVFMVSVATGILLHLFVEKKLLAYFSSVLLKQNSTTGVAEK